MGNNTNCSEIDCPNNSGGHCISDECLLNRGVK